MTDHRTYPAAAKAQFPYADWGGGNGSYCVVRKCARCYVRGRTLDWWRKWHIKLFQTEAEAVENMALRCNSQEGVGGYTRHENCTHDHFIVRIGLAKDIKKPAQSADEAETAKSKALASVQSENQGCLF